jgi:acyl-CoA thioesterase-1
VRVLPFFVAIALLAACGEVPPEVPRAAEEPPAEASTPPAESSDRPVVVAFGDSLTAGYGLDPGESYPAQLQRLLDERGLEYRVVNEGVNGDTTSMGLTRVGTALSHEPAWVILALGANDGLRGLSVEGMEANLRRMVEEFQQAGARVALAGMTLPPNYGAEYIASFEAVFPRVARDYTLPLLPFLLEGVAAEAELNQDDGIHPTAEGARMVADHVADFLQPLLSQDGAK